MNRHFTRRLTTAPRRGGAVIIVVLSLLSLMLFLGVFFFEFATEEQQNSEYYAGANADDVVNPDVIVNEALEQAIIGPRSDRPWSALKGVDSYTYIYTDPSNGNRSERTASYGNVHSMLSHVLGPIETGNNGTKYGRPVDVIPHNGRGIRPMFLGGGIVRFDHDGDGVADSTLSLTADPGFTVLDTTNNPVQGPEFGFNFSQLAQPDGTTDAFNQVLSQRIPAFAPDTDYTQADHNTLFLAHEEFIGGRRVFVPSFFRPTMFPSSRDSDGNGANVGGGAAGFANLFTAASTARKVLRPHRDHVYPTPTPTRRYLNAVTTAQSGDLDRQIGPFPFSNDHDNDGNANEMGIYSNANESNNYELDVDVDGDGDYDGFWMDMGLGVVDLPDGRQYVPLVSFLILDADGLGNVNVHGNIQGLQNPAFTFDTSTQQYSVSVSNMGLGPQEVNLMRLFTGNPFLLSGSDLTQAQSQYATQYAAYPFTASSAQNPLRLANMDAIFLLSGRRQVVNNVPRSPIAGRFGEEQQLLANVFPRGGITSADDDLDSNAGSLTYDGGHSRTEILYDPKGGGGNVSVTVPPYVHPLSLSGHGATVKNGGDGVVAQIAASIEQRTLLAPVVGNPSAWPDYPLYDAPAVPGAGVTPLAGSDYPGLITGPSWSTTTDEENEAIAAHDSRDRANDSLFEASENVFLQASDADYQRSNARSRLEQLLPFNLRSARDAADIRKRLTTDSWDLNQLTYVNLRASESNAWLAGGAPYFPPIFGGLNLISDSPNPFVPNANDPFRPELRRLLRSQITFNTSQIGAGRTQLRQQLNINRLLVGFDANNNPIYRNLMPHPETTTATTIPAMIHDHTASPPFPFTAPSTVLTDDAQEWWARFDRQRMARDIYTLLYLTGARSRDLTGDDPASTPFAIGPTNYPDRQRTDGTTSQAGNGIPENVEEMAQFAINVVDALDRDDVISTFEYDPNLSDGWDSAPTQKVYGIERQSLTFSEVALWQLKRESADRVETLYKEDDTTHRILHIELRNATPFPVPVNEGWRIVRVPTNRAVPEKWYSFRTGDGSKVVSGGNTFHIACHDGTLEIANPTVAGSKATSDLWANIDADPELESILPNSGTTISDNQQEPPPQADIDLSQISPGEDHEQYVHTGPNGGGYAGTTLVEADVATAPVNYGAAPLPVEFDLVLQRRQNLNGTATSPDIDLETSSAGRWIEVDRFHVDSGEMGGTEGQFAPANDSASDNQTALTTLHSRERRQPFDPRQGNHSGTSTRNHTISATLATKHGPNQLWVDLMGPTEPFTLWQPHFDRDFASIYELLSVPLYGNFPLATIQNDFFDTYSPDVHGGTIVNLAKGDVTATGGASLAGDYTAGVRFLFPNGKPSKPYFGWNAVSYANNWYRFLNFVQVPRRTEQAIASQYPNNGGTIVGAFKPLTRTPGLINLNTVRDQSVLAALLDDDLHFPLASARSTTDDAISGGRNWYNELRVSRDGVDSFMTTAGFPTLTIPGTMSPASLAYTPKPFRPLGHVDLEATADEDNGIENTILRSRPTQTREVGPANTTPAMGTIVPNSGNPWSTTSPATSPANPTNDWQGLLDSRDINNHEVDFHTRNRLMAKAANNSTTKSHVFFVWVAVGYFEAHETTVSGVKLPQIGARITDLPIHRVFSVVDMTRLEDAYDPYTRTFDYSKFVIHRKRLR
jgi:hypothetical protein